MLQELINTLAIPIQVAQIGSPQWLLAMLVALNFGTAVLAARAVARIYMQARRSAHVRTLLTRDARRH